MLHLTQTTNKKRCQGEKLVQYWIRNTLAIAVSMGLVGCTVFTNEAHHERNYRANEPLKVPENLSKPYQDATYSMQAARYEAPDSSAYVRSPAQVLALAEGSWVEEGDTEARVHFDKNDGIEDLEAFIWQSLNDLLAQHNVSSTKLNDSQLQSDWYALTKQIDGWFWEEEKKVSRQKFMFTLEAEEHKRTVAVSAKLTDFEAAGKPLTNLMQQQLEVGALNAFIAQFDYNYRNLALELNKKRGIVSLEMGFDDKGNAAFVTEQRTEDVFERFPTFLERVGFTIDEIEQDRGLIFATYNEPDSSVWDSIWGDDVGKIPLEVGQYQMIVSDLGESGTSITWLDGEGETLEPGTLNDLLMKIVTMLRERGINI